MAKTKTPKNNVGTKLGVLNKFAENIASQVREVVRETQESSLETFSTFLTKVETVAENIDTRNLASLEDIKNIIQDNEARMLDILRYHEEERHESLESISQFVSGVADRLDNFELDPPKQDDSKIDALTEKIEQLQQSVEEYHEDIIEEDTVEEDDSIEEDTVEEEQTENVEKVVTEIKKSAVSRDSILERTYNSVTGFFSKVEEVWKQWQTRLILAFLLISTAIAAVQDFLENFSLSEVFENIKAWISDKVSEFVDWIDRNILQKLVKVIEWIDNKIHPELSEEENRLQAAHDPDFAARMKPVDPEKVKQDKEESIDKILKSGEALEDFRHAGNIQEGKEQVAKFDKLSPEEKSKDFEDRVFGNGGSNASSWNNETSAVNSSSTTVSVNKIEVHTDQRRVSDK